MNQNQVMVTIQLLQTMNELASKLERAYTDREGDQVRSLKTELITLSDEIARILGT